jgi:hypothetical protein
MEKVCRDFMKQKCNRNGCRYIHDKDLCRNFYKNNKCRDDCKFSHNVNPALVKLFKDGKQGAKRHKAKNTTDFNPSHEKADMRIVMAPNDMKVYTKDVYPKDVVLVNNLFGGHKDMNIYEKLLEEIQTYENEQDNNKISVFKLWHGDSHLIADDKIGWKNNASTFDYVIDVIRNYFNMDIKATRFNWYKSTAEWKPYHHDAAALKPDKAKTQNFTVGVSFGVVRDIAFEHAESKKVVSFPLENGSTFCFAKDVNVEWRHGVPQLPPEQHEDKGRISIIAWGSIELKN